MKNYVQPGDVMTFVAPSGGVVAGNGYLIGGLFVVAVASAASGAEFAGQATGVFVLPKTSAQAWTQGVKLYWDATPGEATTAPTGNTLIGVAALAAANPSATGTVRLNGTAA